MSSERASPTVFAFFIEDEGGWWSFKGIHLEKEKGIALIEKFKHGKHCKGILAFELPNGHKIYEWQKS